MTTTPMSRLDITLNGRRYTVACEDGQEVRLGELAHYVDSRVRQVARAALQATDAHHLALAALMLADEVFDLRTELLGLKTAVDAGPARSAEEESSLTVTMDELTRRLERMAAEMERPAQA